MSKLDSLNFSPASGSEGCLDLPIYKHKADLISSFSTFSTTIVVGETGSGKSTQLPKYLAEAVASSKNKGFGRRQGGCIICTQPRRVAAVTVAQRVAKELNCVLGQEVGYSIRFEDKTSKKTVIKFVTDGVLLREMMTNPDMKGYSCIILDEAHERSLNTDILMGLCKDLQLKNTHLKLVVMSATLQVELFRSFFLNTNVLTIPGRQFPVSVLYLKDPEEDYIDAALRTCIRIHEQQPTGGVLVFLPGQEDIESLQTLLEEYLPTIDSYERTSMGNSGKSQIISAAAKMKAKLAAIRKEEKLEGSGDGIPEEAPVVDARHAFQDFEVCPLYAAMPPDQQLATFAPPPPGIRKFILSTNIAETSVTISGIKYVVDVGYFKCRLLESATGVEMLKVTPVSQAQANQRAGRAGRECPGTCYRAYTEPTFEGLIEASIPEIQRVSVSQVILQLKCMGVKDILKFNFVSPPAPATLTKAMQDLYLLGAIDKQAELTTRGRHMASLPLDPVYARLVLLSAEERFECAKEILVIVSMLSTENVFLQPHKDEEKATAAQVHKRYASRDGDLATLLNIYTAWKLSSKSASWAAQNYLSQRSLVMACNINEQLQTLLGKLNIDVTTTCLPEKEKYLRCLAKGFCLNVAQKTKIGGMDHGSSNSNNSHREATMLRKNQKNIKDTRAFAASIGLGNAVSSDHDTIAPYMTVRGKKPVFVHPTSVVFNSSNNAKKMPDLVVYSEILITSKQYMRGVTVIEAEWLTDDADVSFYKAKKPLMDNTEKQECKDKGKEKRKPNAMSPEALAASHGSIVRVQKPTSIFMQSKKKQRR